MTARVLQILGITLGFAVGALSGCEGVPAHQKPWRRPPSEPPALSHTAGTPAAAAAASVLAHKAREHTLRVRREAEPAHLDPPGTEASGPDRETLEIAWGTIFEPLVARAPGNVPGVRTLILPRLAENFRIASGGREIRFTLRDDVKFHDGRSFSVVDAQFSIDLARTRSIRLRERLRAVLAVEIVGPKELRVLLKPGPRPGLDDGYVLAALAEVPMLPAHVYGPGGPAWRGAHRLAVGTGPFKLGKWEHGVQISLVRNDAYWGAPSALAGIDFVIEPDAARALMRAKRGELDLIPAMSWIHVPGQVAVMARDFTTIHLEPPRLRYAIMNAARPPFDDVRVRQAAVLAIDRRRLADEVWHGTVRQVAGPIWPGGPGDGQAPQPPAFDPAAAGRLLDEAGWIDSDKDGVRDKDGARLHVILLAGTDKGAEADRELVVEGLRKVGFQIELRAGDPAVLMVRLKDGTFDLALMDYRGHADDDLSPMFASDGARNWGKIKSPELDDALEAAAGTWELAVRAARLGEVARLLLEVWPIVPLYAPAPLGLIHKRVGHIWIDDGWIDLTHLTLAPDPAP
jgi:ABC-type transport system substrate-binding protein